MLLLVCEFNYIVLSLYCHVWFQRIIYSEKHNGIFYSGAEDWWSASSPTLTRHLKLNISKTRDCDGRAETPPSWLSSKERKWKFSGHASTSGSKSIQSWTTHSDGLFYPMLWFLVTCKMGRNCQCTYFVRRGETASVQQAFTALEHVTSDAYYIRNNRASTSSKANVKQTCPKI